MDETIVYQWDTNSYIYQINKGKKINNKKEAVINGKTIAYSYYYVTLSVYQKIN